MAASRSASSRMRLARASAARARASACSARASAPPKMPVAQRDAAANVIVAVVLDHAVAAGVDAGGELRQPVGAGGARLAGGAASASAWALRTGGDCSAAAAAASSRLGTAGPGIGARSRPAGGGVPVSSVKRASALASRRRKRARRVSAWAM